MEDDECFDSSTLEILKKARIRQVEIDEHEKENDADLPSAPTASSTPSTLKKTSITMKDKFAKLSSAVDEFDYETRPSPVNIDKEKYLHGPQKRVSMGGETRPEALFCPSKVSPAPGAARQKKEVAFTFPDRLNDSHPHSSDSEANEITQGPLESTCIDGSTGSRQYAQVHFSSKNTPTASAASSASMKISPIAAEKPTYYGEPSPIVRAQSDDEDDDAVFDDTSSTKAERSESTLTEAENSAATVITVKAKSIAQQFEERSRQNQIAATSNIAAQRKPTKFPTKALPRALQAPVTPVAPPPVAGPNPNIEEKKIGSVRSLMARWEVSSITGAVLHPDQKDQDLLQSAVAMAKSVNRPKFTQYPKSRAVREADALQEAPALIEAENEKAPVVASAISQAKQAEVMESTDSPCHKSPRLNISQTSVHDSSTITACSPEEVLEEDDLIDDDDSDSETETSIIPKELGEDSYIDKQFGFMDGSPYKTGNSCRLAPLAEVEQFRTPQADNVSLLDAINTEVRSKVDTPRAAPSSEVQTTPSLAHSISFYRKRRAEAKTPSGPVIAIGNTPKVSLEVLKEVEHQSPDEDNDRVNHAMLKRIEETIAVEEEHIKQATRAFAHCRGTPEFRGSREEVDAQRALLISQERRKTLIAERDRLVKNPKEVRLSGPRGSLVISEMTFRLTRDFVNAHINASNDGMLYYFIALIKYDDVVEHTAMVTSDDGLRSGHIDFSHYLQLKRLRPDFKIRLEIHGLKTQRELISHQEKYRSRRGSTSKGSKHKSFSSSQASSLCMSLTGFITSPGGPHSVIDAAFQKLGELTLDINLVKQQKFALCDAHYPLDGSAVIKMRSYAEESRAVNHRGFVSLYETIQGLGSWNRLWCSLTDGKLRFWRYPEDEDTKETYCEFDMRWCINEVVPTPEDVKSFQHSMQMDMVVPATECKSSDKIRVLLAADTKESMSVWVAALNKTIRNLLLWTGASGR